MEVSKAQNPSKKKEDKLYILTYNVRTLASYERLIELSEALREIKYDVIGLSETRRSGSKIEEYENCILCHTGDTPGKYGVGFLIKKHHKESIESFIGISERIALLNINIQGYKISIIQIYAPTTASTEEEINNFYINLNKAIGQAQKDYIIMGDANAKIGQPKKDEYLITKMNGYGERNQRGQRLIDFALENKLSILNTFFKKKSNRKWTWRSPNGKHRNEIDYILSNRPDMFQNLEVLNLNFPSDHRPVRATIKLSKQKKDRTRFGNYRNSALENEGEKTKYKECIKSHLPELIDWQENTTVQTYYEKLIQVITQSLQSARSTKETTNKRRKILSERTETLIKRRQILHNTKNKTLAMKNETSALYKLISKYIKYDYARHRFQTIEKHMKQAGSSKKALKELRTNTTWIEGLNQAGSTSNNRNDIMRIATEFYKTLYSTKTQKNTVHSNTNSTYESNKGNITQIDESEVIEAIKRLKTDKSPGSDHITNEALKITHTDLTQPLTHLFNCILKTAETPKQWSESNITLIYKKGDPNDIANYRPISLLPCIYKLFSSIINRRISITLEAKQPIEQAGFRKSFSTIDHIHTLELIIEKYQEKQRALYVTYIDYKKAFDTISHTSIWEALREQEVESEYIKVIKSIYNNNTGRVKLEKTGPSFPIQRGVRQGDPMSPKLFIAVLEAIIKKLDWKQIGLNINGKYLSHLRFADDLVLLSESSLQTQCMIESLNMASKQVGLEMNLSKTMLTTNSTKKKITIDNEILAYTGQYIYLGKQIGFDRKNNELEIERRIQRTWNKYWSLREIFKSSMPINIKTKVMTSCLLPCLTYACQTWKYTSTIKSKITSCQRGIERSMLNIRKIQKIRHTKIRNMTKATDALRHAQKLKWQWAGHIARLQDERWTKKITMWEGPKGKRHKGRPHTRWEDDMTKTAGPRWLQLAQDRDKWISLGEAFT